MPQLAFSLTPLHTFTEPQTFDQVVTVVAHPDGNGLSALQYLDGSYASWLGTFWDTHKPSAGAGERFMLSGNLISAYRNGGVAVFGSVSIAALP